MKIAFVHHWYPALGGTEKYVTSLTREYKKMGHQVFILTSKPASKKNDGLFIIESKKFLGYLIPKKKSVIKTLKQISPDIIHLQGPHPYSSYFALVAGKLKIPVINTFQAPVNPSNPLIKIAAYLENLLYKKIFNKIIVTTAANKIHVSKFYPENRIQVINLGIEEIYFRNPFTKEEARKHLNLDAKAKLVLFVGQMDSSHYYKGIPELITAASQCPETTFLLIGDGNKKNEFQKLAGNASNIKFIGSVSQEQLPLYYKAADLFILPSTSNSEGFGMVLVEALASGTAVITTKCTGASTELANFSAAKVIEEKNPAAIKAAISELLSDEKLRKNYIKNSQKLLDQHHWPKIAIKVIEYYKTAI